MKPVMPSLRQIAAVGVVVAASCVAGLAQGGGAKPQDRPPVPGAPAVRVSAIKEQGGRLDWSGKRNLIAFDKLGRDDFFDIYTMTPEGGQETCLTCDKPQLPNRMIGNPSWHPSGDYIVFQAQNTYRGFGRITNYFANPGAGINNDVWVMDASGTRFWQLTKVEPRIGGVLHPHFSPDGTKLLWAQRVATRGLSAGVWSLRVADFVVADGMPVIRNERTLQPGRQNRLYETHGFSADGRSIIFSGNLEPGQSEIHGDIYTLNLASGELKNLTNSMEEWDEHAHFSPDGRTIIWMTSKAQPYKLRADDLKTDYWLMNADGTNKRRLTYFNQAGHPHFMKEGVAAADGAWSPDGRRFFAYLIVDVRRGGKMVMIDLDDSAGRALLQQ
jgi:Tol biopolymer transport system component